MNSAGQKSRDFAQIGVHEFHLRTNEPANKSANKDRKQTSQEGQEKPVNEGGLYKPAFEDRVNRSAHESSANKPASRAGLTNQPIKAELQISK